jgi:hypothetical protein
MTRSIGAAEIDPAQERRKRLRQRNWAVGLSLVAFVVLIYVVTIVKMKGG